MIDAARKAARGLARDFGEVTELQVSKKGAADFVSNADLKAEQTLFEILEKARPGYGFLGEERGMIEGWVRKLGIKTPSISHRIDNLSGGNQQKVVIGKALLTVPDVVMLDEPTRGIDVGAKIEIYEMINQLTAEGKAVLLVSSELPELIGMSDRIVMLREGRVGGSFVRGDVTQKKLMQAAMELV